MFLITRRGKRWVINCRRDDLMKKDANYLYNQCRMCDEHFDASQFMDPASKRDPALNIKLLESLAQGASRFEKSLAPPKIHWPPIFFKRRKSE